MAALIDKFSHSVDDDVNFQEVYAPTPEEIRDTDSFSESATEFKEVKRGTVAIPAR